MNKFSQKPVVVSLILLAGLSLVALVWVSFGLTWHNTADIPGPSVIPEPSGIQEEIDTSEWLTYRNEEYGFEIRYPGEWGNINYDDANIVFSLSKNNSIIRILPVGGLDYGLPWDNPMTETTNLASYDIVSRIWIMPDQKILQLYHFVDLPNSQSLWRLCDVSLMNCNRIEINTDSIDYSETQTIISSIDFID